MSIEKSKNNLNIDNYLNFSDQFIADNSFENGYNKKNVNRKIDLLISEGSYCGLRVANIKGKIQLTPIYKDIDLNLLKSKRIISYDENNLSIGKIGHELTEGNYTYILFNNLEDTKEVVNLTKDKVNSVIK